MRIPQITLKFDAFLAETEKAIYLDINGSHTWLPKSICSNIQIKGKRLLNGTCGHGTLNIAPFKYEEITGVVPQSLDSLVIDEIADTLKYNQLPDYDIVEPSGINLFDKQIDIIIRIKRLRCFFLYGQMRTGKTVVATTIAHSRINAGIADNIIVIAPLRTKSVWENHIKDIPFSFIATEHLSNINTRDKINVQCDEKTFIILDESHQIKNNGTARLEVINKLTANAGQKCILTGTPIGKHAGDLYNQFYFLDPAIINYPTYRTFEESHLLFGGRDGKKVVAYTGIEEISKRISPYTAIMRRKDMNIDREKQYEVVTYSISNRPKYDELNTKYKDLYEKRKHNGILGYMVKLQQCANGYEIDDEDNCVGYSDNGRISCLNEILSRFKDKSIVIYFKYNEDLQDLKKLNIPILSGKTKRKEFDTTIELFNRKEIRIIGLQQQISIGFSLKACDVMIYFSRKFGSISSAQSEDRACENSDIPLKIIDIAGEDTIDEHIKKTINKQFNIIDIFKTNLK